jgi:hypothetical protein
LYQEIGGTGSATLIRNMENLENKFRVMASVHLAYNSGVSFDLMPVNVQQETTSNKQNRKRRSAGYDSDNNFHVLKKRTFHQGFDFIHIAAV